jgi:tripartite ATP-independent transporter DctM subunit
MLLITLGLLLFLLAIGTKIAWALGIAGMAMAVVIFGWENGLRMIGTICYDRGTSFALTCMPLFIFMGEMMMRSGMNDVVFDGMGRLTRGIPGGILQTTIGTSAVFAASCGSSVACTATVAAVAYPALVKRGYPRAFSATTIATGGTLGILIPPSMQFVVYASLVGESVSKLFIAGIMPGLMLTAMFCLYIAARALLRPQDFPPRERGFNLLFNLSGLLSMWPIAILIFLVLVTMYIGVATPTEAAAFGTVGAIFLTFFYQRQGFFKSLYEGALATLRTTSMIMFLIIGASILTFILTHLRLTDYVLGGIMRYGLTPLTVFLMVCVVYVILGMFLDAVSMMVLSLPFLYPVMIHLGFNGIWFGVIVVLWLEVAFLTPPFCMGLFILSGISKVPMDELIPDIFPYLGIFVVAIALMYAFPGISLWLVGMMR